MQRHELPWSNRSSLQEAGSCHEGDRHLPQARHIRCDLLLWESKYEDLENPDLERIKELESELLQYERR